MGDARKLLRKVVANAYDGRALGGDTFDLSAVHKLVRSDAAVANLGDELLDMAIADAVTYIDSSRRSRTEPDLFGDLDRVLAIGDGIRRRKGSCDKDDYAAHMEIVTANAAAVVAAAAKEQAEYTLLLPHLDAGLTVDEAANRLREEEQ